jgi:hypothetical protein
LIAVEKIYYKRFQKLKNPGTFQIAVTDDTLAAGEYRPFSMT